MKLEEIQAANNISNPDLILVGQNLTIPLPCSCDDVGGEAVVHYGHVVAPGNSVELIAQQYNVSQDTLMQLNSLSVNQSLLAGDVIDVPLKGIIYSSNQLIYIFLSNILWFLFFMRLLDLQFLVL